MVNPIGLLAIVVLPILILVDSKKRLGGFSWEWAIISYLAMSTYMVLLNDIVFPQWFTGRPFSAAWLRGAVTMFGPFALWGVYKAVEHPIRTTGKKWMSLRTISSLFILIVIVGGYLFELTNYMPKTPIVGNLLILGSLGFIIGQIGMYLHCDKATIAHGEEIKKEDITIETKKCPSCAEEINFEALVCRYCGHKFDEAEVAEKIAKQKTRIKEKEEYLQAQASLKKKQAIRRKMNLFYKLCRISGAFLSFLGIFCIMLFIAVSLDKPSEFGIIATFGVLSFLFILPGILMFKKAKKIKADWVKINEEIEELPQTSR